MRYGWWLILLLMLIQPMPVFAQTNAPQPVAAYWTLVVETEAAAAAETVDSAVWAELTSRWATLDTVQLEDGQVLEIDTGFYTTLLADANTSTERRAVRNHMRALLNAQATWSAASDLEIDNTFANDTVEPTPNADETAGAQSQSGSESSAAPIATPSVGNNEQRFSELDEIIENEEFDYGEEDARVEDAEPGWFENLFENEPETPNDTSSPGLSWLSYIAGALAIAAILGAIFWFLKEFRSNMVEDVAVQPDEIFEDISADEALDKASEKSEEGNYRDAVRYLYLSALLLLEERNVLRYDRAKTNREYLRSVADRPELAQPLRSVVDIFDRVWYGFQPLSASDYQYYQAEVEALRNQRGTN